jgi:hypothetical protein
VPSLETQAILDGEPEQDDAMGLVLSAFRDLLTSRSIGMAYGPIAEDKCADWCRRHGLALAAADLVWAVIRRLDNERAERERKP